MEPEAVLEAVAALDRGEAVLAPGDEGYALAADALDMAAVQRLRDAAGLPPKAPCAVAVAHLGMLEQVARAGPLARRVAERFLPGPLGLLLPPDPGVPDELRGSSEGLEVRVPGAAALRTLCARFGPVALVPAAPHPGAHPPTAPEARARLPGAARVVVDAGVVAPVAVTLLDLTGRPPRVARAGAVPASELEPWLSTSTSA